MGDASYHFTVKQHTAVNTPKVFNQSTEEFVTCTAVDQVESGAGQ